MHHSSPNELLEGLHHLLCGHGDVHCVKRGGHGTGPALVLAQPAADCVAFPIDADTNQELTLISILGLWGEGWKVEKHSDLTVTTQPWVKGNQ